MLKTWSKNWSCCNNWSKPEWRSDILISQKTSWTFICCWLWWDVLFFLFKYRHTINLKELCGRFLTISHNNKPLISQRGRKKYSNFWATKLPFCSKSWVFWGGLKIRLLLFFLFGLKSIHLQNEWMKEWMNKWMSDRYYQQRKWTVSCVSLQFKGGKLSGYRLIIIKKINPCPSIMFYVFM